MDKINQCFGSFFPKYKEYWLWVVQSGETYPTSVFVYSILRDAWFYFEFTSTICTGNYHIEAANTIDSLIGTIDEQNWTMESSYLEGMLASIVLGKEVGDVQVIDDKLCSDNGYYDAGGTWIPGTIVPTRLITRDFFYQDISRQDRTTQLNFEAYGKTVDVGYSSYYETDPTAFEDITEITLTPQHKERHYFPDAVGEHIRFCFESDDFFLLRWMQPYAIPIELMNE